MFEIAPRHAFSNRYEFRTPQQELVELKAATFRERAIFLLHGVEHALHREGRMRGPFLLDRQGEILAQATKPSAFRDHFELQIGESRFTLKKTGFFSRSYEVLAGDQRVGLIEPVHTFSRRARVDLPDDWPLAVQLFVFWLVLLMWNRQAAAAAGA